MTDATMPDMKPAAEYCDADLVDLALQVYARSFEYPHSMPLHDRWVECRKELVERFARLNVVISDDKRDAARYRAIRGLISHILEDEAGISGVAFDYQLPMTLIKDASEEELLDAVADAAAAMDAEEAPK